jgi:hypothetical protein
MDDYTNNQNYSTTRDYSNVIHNQNQNQPNEGKKYFKWFLITLGVLCLITILGLGYLVYNLGKTSSANTSSTSSKLAQIVPSSTGSSNTSQSLSSLSSSTSSSSSSSASKKTFTDPNLPKFSLEQGDWVLKETTQPTGTGKYYNHIFTKGDATFTVVVGNNQQDATFDRNAIGLCLTDDQVFDMGDGWFRAKFGVEGPVTRKFVKYEDIKFDRKSGKGYTMGTSGLTDITCPANTVATLDAGYDVIVGSKSVSFNLSPENVGDRAVADALVKSIKF